MQWLGIFGGTTFQNHFKLNFCVTAFGTLLRRNSRCCVVIRVTRPGAMVVVFLHAQECGPKSKTREARVFAIKTYGATITQVLR